MFRRKAPIEDHVVDWLFETYAWLLREFGGMDELRLTKLVLPTPEHFPVEDVEYDELASEMFLLVKQHARMLDWPCRLVASERGSDPHDAMLHVPIISHLSTNPRAYFKKARKHLVRERCHDLQDLMKL